jgi:hypothetical protein
MIVLIKSVLIIEDLYDVITINKITIEGVNYITY